jgi:elongation factor Tu
MVVVNAEAAGQDFVLTIHDVFTITGRGTVVVGRVESGLLRPGETVEVWAGGQLLATAPAWIDMICGRRDPRHISLLLGGIGKDVLACGQTVRRPATALPN